MTWKLIGRRTDLKIALSDTGSAMFHGWPESQIVRPTVVTSIAAIRRIEKATSTWTICLATDSKEIFAADMLSPRKPSLAERVKQLPNQRHGSITFFTEPVDTVALTLVASPADYGTITNLMKIVAQADSFAYELSVDFIGFPVTPSSTGNPTESEFLSGVPLPIEQFSLAINARAKDD
jgi:hypothetical protein